ncbi:LysR family transcriptional regulator YnfL [Klebsiella pneumoniae]|uniref:LysR family transcriptional regulator YnfL n=1 Tax=Klebsiella pneumoniae TaxID=573 RepID=A0A377WPM7_KLEPN|nr:LysR family transcriptional regulator YnfL [Klebsiella pneumoniae]
MHITQPGVILDWLEDGLEAATLLPSSEVNAEKLPHCYVVDVFPSPQIFYPALVKLPSMPYLPAADGYYSRGLSFYRAEGVEIREKA